MDTTTIEITTEQKASLESRKVHDREPIREVVGRLLEGDADTVEQYAVGDDEPVADLETVLADVGVSLTYDDAVQACRQAIREELPVDQMGGRP